MPKRYSDFDNDERFPNADQDPASQWDTNISDEENRSALAAMGWLNEQQKFDLHAAVHDIASTWFEGRHMSDLDISDAIRMASHCISVAIADWIGLEDGPVLTDYAGFVTALRVGVQLGYQLAKDENESPKLSDIG